MRKIIIFLFIVFSSARMKAQTPADIKKLDSVLTVLNKTNRFNGAVLYAEKGKIIYKKAFGVTDFRSNLPLKTTSAFNLASITKQFICMCILIMKERGQLQFDDNCKKYIQVFAR